MIVIRVGASEEYIDFGTSYRTISTEYIIRSTLDDPDQLDLESVDLDTLPRIPLQAECDPANEPEFSLRHRLFQKPLESPTEYVISAPPTDIHDIPCTVLPLDVVQRALKFRRDAEFTFNLLIVEHVSIDELIATQTLTIEQREGERIGEQIVTVLNRTTTRSGPVPIINYSTALADLREEIIWKVHVDGLEERFWHIEINELTRPFLIQEYLEYIDQALALVRAPVLERIPLYLEEHFPSTNAKPLPVKVVIDELIPNKPLSIRYQRREPERELFYRTGRHALDELLITIHGELLQRGLSVGPSETIYQKVLSQFLIYRDGVLIVPRFIDRENITRNEESFHDDLHIKLSLSLDFGEPVLTEVEAGNSRIDLLIAGLPTELKLERRRTPSTEKIIDSYAEQAADYVSRCGSRLGFLVVLDAVLDRDTPVPLAEQDIKIVDVVTSSGDTVTVIGLIIRLPKSASDFS